MWLIRGGLTEEGEGVHLIIYKGEQRNIGNTEVRSYGVTEQRNNGNTDLRINGG